MATSFIVNEADLAFILKQIKVAEAETLAVTTTGVTAAAALQAIIGPSAAILPMGLRHVDGSNNNLLPGGELLGAADTVLPRLADPSYTTGTGSTAFSDLTHITNTNYASPGSVVDTAPRTVSNLIVDQTNTNPAAVAAWHANPLAVAAWEAAHPGQVLSPTYIPTNTELAVIQNQSPDIGLSPAFNGWMTFFGQFFDHGLDLITKGANGTVYVPLLPDDPLYVEGGPNFMALTRATPAAGQPTETVNTTTSWIDQNQTYTSHASHQVFLREYAFSVASTPGGPLDSHAVSTGHLLDGANGGIATWAETKAQALTMLGIRLTDADIGNVPLLRTDAYGNFIPGANGYAQIATATGFVEGSAAGVLVPANALRTGHAFLDDIAHHAVPGTWDHDHNPATPKIAQTADTDQGVTDDNDPGTYDDEMLGAHFVTGDGRGNENIGLTAVHTIFHSEHNRLVEANKATLIAAAQTGNPDSLALLNEYLAVDVTAVAPGTTPASLVWDGARLFQAAKFVTEMQYQHLVFEEFARKVQPNVDPFVFTNTADIDPSIVAEFAHTVYRFGHSMLTDTVDRLDANMTASEIKLFDAFLNPQAFNASGMNASEAAGAIIRGMTRQAGNEIDEFVVEALRNQLLGLPLDLAALNIARARDTGIPSFNDIRASFYEATGQDQLKPYVSWFDYAQNLKNPLSIVNFIAAYGAHDSITAETTLAGKRAAAMAIVFGSAQTVADDPDTMVNEAHTIGVPWDRIDFLNSTGAWANAADGRTVTGLNAVDFWIGGLAEAKMEFGGMLGSTFNYVFETQMEKLQNGDRLYYLSRLQGTNLLNQLEPNTFSELVMRNTDLGNPGSSHLPGSLFDTADLILEVDRSKELPNQEDPEQDTAILQVIIPKVVRHDGTVDVNHDGTIDFHDGGYLKFSGGEHVVLGGTEGNDTLIGDRGIDALWGDGGDDYLNARSESDQVFGGDGDDIIEDPFGDDLLRGEGGNDVISGGAGFDILFGGAGSDFVIVGAEAGEVFAGEGNDFIIGGSSADGLMGNEGDDWIQGGDGLDGLSGENSDLFFNSPIIGHDVLNGEGNDTDYDGESGDDIMVQGAGIQRNNGMLGFDWAIHKGDPNAANSDLGIPVFATQQDLTLRDRFDSVEGLSGWKFNDVLTGTNFPTGAAGVGGFGIIGAPDSDSKLTQAGVDRIHGLQTVIGSAALPPNAQGYVFDPTNGGDIILGGDGSDTIRGNAGDDILEGDAWLNVRIAVVASKDGTGPEIATFDDMRDLQPLMLNRTYNPGQLTIVREILMADGADDTDVAVFSGARSEYTITNLGNGSFTVAHTAPVLVGNALADGTDTLRHIERAKFSDQTVTLINRPATGQLSISDLTPTESQAITASLTGLADIDGLPAPSGLHYQWQVSPNGAGWTNIAGATGTSFTPQDAQVNQLLRVLVSFTDGGNTVETLASAPTTVVGDLFNGGNGNDNRTFTAGEDVAFGNGGADTLSGAAGADSLSGGAGTDSLAGGSENDTLDGGGGADTLNGGTGADVMTGGDGNDSYVVDEAGDVLTEQAGEGTDLVQSSITYTLGANVENLALLGVGAINGTGNVLANTLTGNDAANLLAGLEGNDTLQGGGGADTLDGGAGADRMVGGQGDDTYQVDNTLDTLIEQAGGGIDQVFSTVSFTLDANLENLTLSGPAAVSAIGNSLGNILVGNAGVNVLMGNDGSDTLRGGDGNDMLNGGTGADSMEGGAGADAYNVDNAGDVILELAGDGTDEVRSSISYTLGANVENLVLLGSVTIGGTGNELANAMTGNGAANQLAGLTGRDTLSGGGGDDTLAGGAGADQLTGGQGADMFLFDVAPLPGSQDTITDFTAGADKIAMALSVFGGGLIAGTLASQAGHFAQNLTGAASGAGAQFTYETDARQLWWDADGIGGAAGVVVASFSAGTPALTASDIVLV